MGEGRKDDPKVPNLHGSDTKMSLLDVPSNYQARVRSTCFRSKPSIFDSKSLHISTLKTSLERVGCAYKKKSPWLLAIFPDSKKGTTQRPITPLPSTIRFRPVNAAICPDLPLESKLQTFVLGMSIFSLKLEVQPINSWG